MPLVRARHLTCAVPADERDSCSTLIIGFLASSCGRNVAGASEAAAVTRCWLPFDRQSWLAPFSFREPLALRNTTVDAARRASSWLARLPDELVFRHGDVGFRVWLGAGRPTRR